MLDRLLGEQVVSPSLIAPKHSHCNFLASELNSALSNPCDGDGLFILQVSSL